MNSRTIARAALLLLLISAALPTAVDSCFITTQNVAFFRTRPDATFKEFLNGNLGVIQPRWRDSYLYAAYRQLSGQPFSEGEKKELIGHYVGLSMGFGFVIDTDPDGKKGKDQEAARKRREEDRPIHRWIVAREQVPGAKNNELEIEERDLFFAEYVNCTDDAFLTAIATLKDRQQRFGKDSEYLHQWLEGQDTVFLNCQKGTPSIPENLGENAPLLLRQDRAYQQAAAYFYAQDWDKAREGFHAVAADPASPWSAWAPYLAARCLIRKSTLTSGDAPFDEPLLTAAEKELSAAIAQAKEPRVRRAAAQIMDFVRFRLHPQEYRRELNQVLSKPSDEREFLRRLKDYLGLAGPKSTFGVFSDSDAPSSEPELESGEIADWMWALGGPPSQSLATYRSNRTLPWLIAALMTADGSDKTATDELLADAAKVPTNSPGYLTVNLHRVRLLRARGAKAEARTIARAVLARTDLSPSTRNLFRAQLASDAETFDEFLENSASALAGTATDNWEDMERRNAIRPSVEGAWIFNHELPLGRLMGAAQSERLAKEVRRELAPAVWTRAILLDNLGAAEVVAPHVTNVAPELEKLMAAFTMAATRDEKLHAAWFALVKAPGLSPYVNDLDPRGAFGTKDLLELDHLRANWWCNLHNEHAMPTGAVQGKPDFVSLPESQDAAAEWSKITAVEDAPIYLAKNILAWAKQTPDDPRIPEALHRVVQATRYSCSNEEITQYSKAAFQLLHQKYPKSEWTTKTKYYF